ncbi:MAG TPA: hypothetical protein VK668_04705 [Mucilaginibacter sp.]|nr:hypothetical protein [Mucilaginibacter sp.]
MSKNKSERNIERINLLKEKFRHLSTETIAARLTNFSKSNDISIAYKEILKERGIEDYLSVIIQAKSEIENGEALNVVNPTSEIP